MSGTRKILFLDRDGTLIAEPADQQIDSLDKFRLIEGVVPALIRFRDAGYRFVMVSNQDGLGGAQYPQASFDAVQAMLVQILDSQGIAFDEVLICPHLPAQNCLCRKPGIGLVQFHLASSALDRTRSLVIGDRETDLQLAGNMGLEGILFGPEPGRSWERIAADVLTRPRRGRCQRVTRETKVTAEVNLDGTGLAKVSTGIGFFDHMLEQIAKHSGCDVSVEMIGDGHVDDHHTVEDTGLALGAAFREALGDKVGIARFGFYLPMDDSSAQVALDLCGRAYSRFEGTFEREKVGELATEMVPHFFRSFADGLQANLHVKVEGQNTHHRIEAAFKGVGRSLRLAVAAGQQAGVPSTKGSL